MIKKIFYVIIVATIQILTKGVKMKLAKLSLATALCVSCAFGADTFADAFLNAKVSAEFRAWYFNKKTDTTGDRKHIHNLGVQLGYLTDPFYGFRLGLTGQGNVNKGVSDEAKALWDKEQWGNGFVLSEAYIGYGFAKSDIKVGRQFVRTPVVAGNPTRIFNEAFEGVSVESKDLADTTLYANWFYKFQGRTSRVNMPANTKDKSKAPTFKDRVILAGTGPWTHEIDNVYSVGVSNKSVENLTLAAQYAYVDGVNWQSSRTGNSNTKKGEISLYYAEANYVLPFEALKLKFDAQYRGSRTDLNGADETKSGAGGAKRGYDGDMIGLRVGFSDLFGVSASIAYTSVTDKDALIVGVGNGPTTYTMLPIRGPYVFTSHAGMDMYKLDFGYDFKTVGVNGLKASAAYVWGEQDGQKNNYDITGYAVGASYDVAGVKGLNVAATYVKTDKDYQSGNDPWDKEFWLKFTYKISNK